VRTLAVESSPAQAAVVTHATLPIIAGSEVAEAKLRALVAAERDTWLAGSRGLAARLAYRGPADLVLREGRSYAVGSSLPLAERTAFAAALHLAAHGWSYLEGFALFRAGSRYRTRLHAWVVSPAGEPVEVHAAAPAVAYLGVQLPPWRVALALAGGSVSALDDYTRGWPLLTWPYAWPTPDQATEGDDGHAQRGPWRDTELLADLRRRPVVWTKAGRPLSLLAAPPTRTTKGNR